MVRNKYNETSFTQKMLDHIDVIRLEKCRRTLLKNKETMPDELAEMDRKYADYKDIIQSVSKTQHVVRPISRYG